MPLIKNTNTLMADNGGNGTNKASTGTFGPSVFKLNEVRQNINRINNSKSNNTTKSTGSSAQPANITTSTFEMQSDDSVLNTIKDLLNQQKAAADNYYKSMYEQQIAQNKQAWENNRNQINANYMRGNRYLNSMYGDAISGAGLSNKARNYQNWQSNLAANRQNYTNNDATALSQYNSGLANNASQLAQGWYNYVLPVYTNRQQTLDDYDYRKYLASL